MDTGSLVWMEGRGLPAVPWSAGAYVSGWPSSSKGCSRSGDAPCVVDSAAAARILDSWTHVILARVTSFHVIAVMSAASRAEAIQEGVTCTEG